MSITVEATYENGVLKPAQPLPFNEHQKVEVIVRVTEPKANETDIIVQRSYGLIGWTGTSEDLEYLINEIENDPLEGP